LHGFVKGKTIREIARDLGVCRNTVRKVLRSGETSFEYERNVQPRPKLGRWTTELDELLESNSAKPAREQLTLIRIFEEFRGRCGAMPGDGPSSTAQRRLRPMSR
jgi:predicted transcriptional regulator